MPDVWLSFFIFALFKYIKEVTLSAMKLYRVEEMKLAEKYSDEIGINYMRMMENAGAAAAAFIRRTFDIEGRRCAVLCGSGNNGGDGFVVARKLSENGAKVAVILSGEPPKTPCAVKMMELLENTGVPVIRWMGDKRAAAVSVVGASDIIVDAVFGTGFHGEPDASVAELFDAVNSAIAAVVALDVPSGVAADAATCARHCVSADFTVAFDALKPAHIMLPARQRCGEITAVDIGIPPEATERVERRSFHIDNGLVFSVLRERSPLANKGSFGRLLNISGCLRYNGAPALSTMTALRCGAGIVELASTADVIRMTASSAVEAVSLPLLADADGYISPDSIPDITEALKKASACLLGCGLGLTDGTRRIVDAVLQNADCPLIIDADGINALARNIDVLDTLNVPVVLTPHIGEMARLTGLSATEVLADRIGVATDFAQRHRVTVVLKDCSTVVASPEGAVYLNDNGNSGLARGGSGDVLAGMISAFVAQRLDPTLCCICGVYLHALAGDRTAARLSQYGMLPSDLPAELCAIFRENDR